MVWTERHIFHDGNLTIKALSPADMGIYQCFVNNKHGQMHADIELNVSGKQQLYQGSCGMIRDKLFYVAFTWACF